MHNFVLCQENNMDISMHTLEINGLQGDILFLFKTSRLYIQNFLWCMQDHNHDLYYFFYSCL